MGMREQDREREPEERAGDSGGEPEEKPLQEDRAQRWTVAVPWLEAQRAAQEEQAEQPEAPRIPASRIGRSAKLGTALGGQATRYAGTRAANLARSGEKGRERLETRHLETALRMTSVLGEMKGAAMKIGQMASFIDTDFLPPEYREIYKEQLQKLRAHAPAMSWEKVRSVLAEEYEQDEPERLFGTIEPEAIAAASIGQVHKGTLRDDRPVAIGCSRSSTMSSRRRTSGSSPAPTTAIPSSTCRRCTRGCRGAACWSANTSRAWNSTR